MLQNTRTQGPGAGQGGSFGQFGQGFGQAKKNFGQSQGGGGNFNYSTAYPAQVTGGQDYGYEGEKEILPRFTIDAVVQIVTDKFVS